jgi:hypothetical protein
MAKDVIVVIGAGLIGQAIARRVGIGKHVLLADMRPDNAKPKWEFPRLCRGGSKSLTYPGVDSPGPSTGLEWRAPSSKHTRGNRIDGWLESDAPDRCAIMQDAGCAAEQGTQGGLFRDILRHSSAGEGSRVEATRASRFERLQN